MKIFYSFFFLIVAFRSFAQDTHYWTQEFGPHSTLMAGSLVAGAEDISMLFYNPGAIGSIKTGAITISANLYRIENIKITNALGQQADFKSNQFATIPLMAGGMLKTKGKLSMAYGLMSPVDFNFDGLARIDDFYPIVDDEVSPGDENVIATSAKSSNLKETIFAFGAGYPLNEHFSVGATALFTLRSQSYSESLLTRMYLNDADQTFVNTSDLENISYWNVRGGLKLGVTYTNGSWSYGLTLSTPTFNMMGTGVVAADIAANNFKLEDQRIDLLASDRQEDLKSTYKSPLSISGGVKYQNDKSTFALAAQYFSSINEYDVLRAKPGAFLRPEDLFGTSSDFFLNVQAAAVPVFNMAVGYEYRINDNLTFNTGFRNDMSYYDQDISDSIGINPVITSWDLYHFDVGGLINKNHHGISCGLLFSWGTTDTYHQHGLVGGDFEESDFLQGEATIVKANYSSIGLMLGYTYNFN